MIAKVFSSAKGVKFGPKLEFQVANLVKIKKFPENRIGPRLVNVSKYPLVVSLYNNQLW